MTLSTLDIQKRSADIFKELVETYMETGEPVGSRTLSRRLDTTLSSASIRNVMADLEEMGLLYSPHTSAGRLPTEEGLRYFVQGLLELGDISEEDKAFLEMRCRSAGQNLENVLAEATSALSGLSGCAGLVLAPKMDSILKHVEFVQLGRGRALAILISEDGAIENRLMTLPEDVSPVILESASRFLQTHLLGENLAQTHQRILSELRKDRADLDELTSKVIEAGIAVWAGEEPSGTGSLMIRGQSNLLQSVTALEDLDRIRNLFQILDNKEAACKLLEASIQAEGIQIFIGADNRLFNLVGCSMVVAPYQGLSSHLLGAIGVVGATRMNYRRIIPLVNYTSKMIGRLIGS